MRSEYAPGIPAVPRASIGWFVALELLCVAGFVVLLVIGKTNLAAAVLLGPFQLLVWFALLRDGRALLMVFTVLLPLAGAGMLPHGYERFAFLPGTTVLLSVIVFTGYLFANRPYRARLRVSEWLPLLVLGTWSTISGVNAVARGWGCEFLLAMMLVTVEVMAIAYFFAAVPRSLRDVRLLVSALVAVTVFVAVCIPLFPAASGPSGPLGGKMILTPFGEVNLNTIGYVVGPSAAIALGVTVAAGRTRTRLWFGAAAFICTLGLVLTKSRGAWLGFGVAFLYVIVRRRSLTLLVSAASAGLVVVLSDVLHRLLVSRAAATTVYDPSLLGRFALWDYAWRIGKANWLFGVGMENFRYVKHFYRWPEPLSASIQYNAHNIYLEVFADLGVVGLAVFLWLLVSSFTRSSNAMKSNDAVDLGLGLSAGVVAYAAHGLVDCVFFQPGVFALLGVLIGLSISLSRLTSVPSVLSLFRTGPLGE
jgi:O-antigen ligase